MVIRRTWNFACFFLRNLALYKGEVDIMEIEKGNHLYGKGLIFNCVYYLITYLHCNSPDGKLP